jgi:hypothetical protein
MSAPASTESSDNPVRESNEPFVALLPSIRRQRQSQHVGFPSG